MWQNPKEQNQTAVHNQKKATPEMKKKSADNN